MSRCIDEYAAALYRNQKPLNGNTTYGTLGNPNKIFKDSWLPTLDRIFISPYDLFESWMNNYGLYKAINAETLLNGGAFIPFPYPDWYFGNLGDGKVISGKENNVKYNWANSSTGSYGVPPLGWATTPSEFIGKITILMTTQATTGTEITIDTRSAPFRVEFRALPLANVEVDAYRNDKPITPATPGYSVSTEQLISYRFPTQEAVDALCNLLKLQKAYLLAYYDLVKTNWIDSQNSTWYFSSRPLRESMVVNFHRELKFRMDLIDFIMIQLVPYDPGWNASQQLDEQKHDNVYKKASKVKTFLCSLAAKMGINFPACTGVKIDVKLDTNMIIMLVVVGVIALLLLSRRQ